MCKLYGYHGWLTRDEARKKIAEKAKKILRTESHGMGYALNVDGVTTIFKCGESFTDAVGGDVTALLQNDFSKLVSLSIHGRTSTSRDRSANHAHPRETKYGPLMHNGVVIPKSKDGWSKEHDLDTDYLAELASTDRLHLADKYLLG
jgi:predicted glutamine amidotransferase